MRSIAAIATLVLLSACGGSAVGPSGSGEVLSDADLIENAPGGSGGSALDRAPSTLDTTFGDMLNNVRLGNGADAVRYDGRLDAAAQAHADDMLARGYFSHDSPEGESGFDRIVREGYNPRAWGENIAAHQRNASQVLEGWENSRSHNEMMNATVFEDFGFAKAGSGSNTRWVLVMGTEAD